MGARIVEEVYFCPGWDAGRLQRHRRVSSAGLNNGFRMNGGDKVPCSLNTSTAQLPAELPGQRVSRSASQKSGQLEEVTA